VSRRRGHFLAKYMGNDMPASKSGEPPRHQDVGKAKVKKERSHGRRNADTRSEHAR